jgi:hypothetical protein
LGLPEFCVGQRHKAIDAFLRKHDDAPAVSAVSAVRPAFFNELFAPEAQATVTAISGLNPYFRLIDKHHKSVPFL